MLAHPAFKYQAGGQAVDGMFTKIGITLLRFDLFFGFKAAQSFILNVRGFMKAAFEAPGEFTCPTTQSTAGLYQFW